MSETDPMNDEFYVCAGICRVDPETNRCVGCGRPWYEPTVPDSAQEAEDETRGAATR